MTQRNECSLIEAKDDPTSLQASSGCIPLNQQTIYFITNPSKDQSHGSSLYFVSPHGTIRCRSDQVRGFFSPPQITIHPNIVGYFKTNEPIQKLEAEVDLSPFEVAYMETKGEVFETLRKHHESFKDLESNPTPIQFLNWAKNEELFWLRNHKGHPITEIVSVEQFNDPKFKPKTWVEREDVGILWSSAVDHMNQAKLRAIIDKHGRFVDDITIISAPVPTNSKPAESVVSTSFVMFSNKKMISEKNGLYLIDQLQKTKITAKNKENLLEAIAAYQYEKKDDKDIIPKLEYLRGLLNGIAEVKINNNIVKLDDSFIENFFETEKGKWRNVIWDNGLRMGQLINLVREYVADHLPENSTNSVKTQVEKFRAYASSGCSTSFVMFSNKKMISEKNGLYLINQSQKTQITAEKEILLEAIAAYQYEKKGDKDIIPKLEYLRGFLNGIAEVKINNNIVKLDDSFIENFFETEKEKWRNVIWDNGARMGQLINLVREYVADHLPEKSTDSVKIQVEKFRAYASKLNASP